MQYLWDVEGNKYLDFFGGIVTIGVGHCNPKVTSKIKEQVDKLQHTSTLFPTEAIVALAEKLAQITPGKLQKSFFTSSGTEANEAASSAGADGEPELRHRRAAAWVCRRIGAGKGSDRTGGVAQGWRDQRGNFARNESVLLSLPVALEVSGVRRRLRERRGESDPDRDERKNRGVYRGTHSRGGGIYHTTPGVFQNRLPNREGIRRSFHLR